MNDQPPLETQENELPRWIQIPAGLVIGLFTLLCALGALSLLFAPNKQSLTLCLVAGAILLLGCFWVLEKCWRLVTGRKYKGGLMSPRALRVVAFFFLVMPIAGLFTGYYRTMGPLAIFQAVSYVLAFSSSAHWRATGRPGKARSGIATPSATKHPARPLTSEPTRKGAHTFLLTHVRTGFLLLLRKRVE